jgi:Tol biopolymer transport system component/tRNA A-37 threonylcarbamoyl transferase component Bud32
MPFSPGEKLGPYEIVGALGEGGMGQVYRARDTRLGRDVAIKVSSARFTERVEREAKAIAALNHPNICQLYDVGPNYLVMELIEGPTLGEAMAAGPIPTEDAIHIARQIADALEEAHSKGIVHRDLKPGNVKLKSTGPATSTVKVLDFGLAKVGPAVMSASGAAVDPENSPTMSIAAATEMGVVLGTAGYMSPEQARGKVVDKRADIWAFGVVLFEMLTGKRLFKGEDASVTLAAVIKEEPDFNLVPAPLRPLLQMCLRKDPAKRMPDIAAAKLMLEQVQESGSQPVQVVPEAKSGSRKMIWAAAAVVILAIAAGAAWAVLRPKPEQPMLQMEITPPNGVKFVAGLTPFALSPDGRRIAFVGTGKDGQQMLWLRTIDSGSAVALAGTENAEIPFWSPDSRWVGFSANGKLQKLDVTSGGQPQVICDIEGRAGGTWNRDGVIVFDQGDKPLLRVSAAGGTPTPILQLDASRNETYHGAPYFLPDGRHLLYYSAGRNGFDLMLASLDGKVNRLLVERGGAPSYAPNPAGGGAILYNVRGQLTARPFDPDKLEFTDQPVTIADGVFPARWWYPSATGLLAYRHGYGIQYQLAWSGRDGKMLGNIGTPGALSAPRISPDQKTIAFTRTSDQNADVWTFDVTRSNTARFTFNPGFDGGPIWSSDGQAIIYASGTGGSNSLVERAASSVGKEAVIASPTGNTLFPTGVSRDGRWLVFIEMSALHSVIGIRSFEDPNKVIHVQDHDRETDGAISPDGRWLLYSAVPATRREILVQSVPKEAGGTASASGKWQISTAGGAQPAWRADGKEIFFVAPDGMMMAVPVESGPDFFRPGEPKQLFQTHMQFDPTLDFTRVVRQYDVTPDGQRFLLNQHVGDATDAPITVVVNWPKLLEKH